MSPLLGLSLHLWDLTHKARVGHDQAQAYLAHHASRPGQTVVIIAGAFPYERSERPFRAGVFQRQIRAVVTGAYTWSPLARAAPASDLGALLCSAPLPEVLVIPEAARAFERFYAEERGRRVTFTPTFTNDRITAYQCVEAAAP